MWCLRATVTMILLMLLLFQRAFAMHQEILPLGHHCHGLRSTETAIDQFHSDISLQETMRQVLDIVNGVESMPTCNKMATQALVYSCASLEGTMSPNEINLTAGADLFVEEDIDIYAARLAVCELKGAALEIPRECQHFVPTEKIAKKRGIRGFWSKNGPTEPTTIYQHYDDITLTDLSQCRMALGLTPQLWTSYSNSRQNAAILCNAAQSKIKNDQQIFLARVLSCASANAAESLYDAGQMYEEVKVSFEEISKKIPQFHQALATTLQQMIAVQLLWPNLTAELAVTHHLAKDINNLVTNAIDTTQILADNAGLVARNLDRMVSEITRNQEQVVEAFSTKTDNFSSQLETYGQDMSIQHALLMDRFSQFLHLVIENDILRQERSEQSAEWQNRQDEQTKTAIIEIRNLTKSVNENLHEALDWYVGVVEWKKSIQAHLYPALAGMVYLLSFGIALLLTRYFLKTSLKISVFFSGLLATGVTYYLFPTTFITLLATDCFMGFDVSWVAYGLFIGLLIGIGFYWAYHSLHWIVHGQSNCTGLNPPILSTTQETRPPEMQSVRLPVNDPNYMASRLPRPGTGPRSRV